MKKRTRCLVCREPCASLLLCPPCRRSFNALRLKDESPAALIYWAANRARLLATRPPRAARPGEVAGG